jgi:F0F1-type ATP synthase assembly protein I
MGKDPSSLAQVGAAGATIVGALAVGLGLGWLGERYLHWELAVPLGILLGFVAGLVSLFRQFSRPT